MNRFHFHSVAENPKLGEALAKILADAKNLPNTFHGVVPGGLAPDRSLACVHLAHQIAELVGIEKPDLLLSLEIIRFARLLYLEKEMAKHRKLPNTKTIEVECGPYWFPTPLNPYQPSPQFDVMVDVHRSLEVLLLAEGIEYGDIARVHNSRNFQLSVKVAGVARDQVQ